MMSSWMEFGSSGRKHPAPEGALRLIEGQAKAEFNALPESTQHHKVH